MKDFSLGTHDYRMRNLVGYREIRQEVTTEVPVMTAWDKAGEMVIRKEEIEMKDIWALDGSVGYMSNFSSGHIS